MLVLAICCAILSSVAANTVSYNGYKVYRLSVTTEEQRNLLQKLSDNSHFDFWTPFKSAGKPVDVMVSPEAQSIFRGLLNTSFIGYKILIDDVEKKLQEEKVIHPQRRNGGEISFTKYNRFYEINSYLNRLQQDHPSLVTVKSIGRSYEGRNLKVIQISSDIKVRKPVIFIDAGIHAREWIAPAMALYIIHQLVENPAHRPLLDDVDWHILPVVNPDGYEHSHVHQRLWRKTRSRNGICIGTDANRNFNFHWGDVGASAVPCSETYMGKRAFSEIETKNLAKYISSWKDRIKLYLTFHSYGNYILFPWGFTSELPADYDELYSLGRQVGDAIFSANGDEYTVGTSTGVLYAAAGGSDDWAKGVAGVELSYTIELPGGGENGFDPPPSQIIEIVEPTFLGIEVYANYIARKFGQ